MMTLSEISGIAPLKGMIGCLGGIYTSDRVVSLNKSLKKTDLSIAA